MKRKVPKTQKSKGGMKTSSRKLQKKTKGKKSAGRQYWKTGENTQL